MAEYTLDELEKRIGYCFKQKKLLKQAITHSSYTNEQKINPWEHYERLEFLGDAVLELISSDFLFHTYVNLPEGKLTKLRASLVCEQALAFSAKEIELGQFLYLGKGEESTGGRQRNSIIADTMESVIAAIYLDGGILEAKKFIEKYILSDIEHKQLFYDSKTTLQEYVQGKFKKDLKYVLLDEMGPEHDKNFKVKVLVDSEELGEGIGKTKKEAEQQAAYKALLYLKEQ